MAVLLAVWVLPSAYQPFQPLSFLVIAVLFLVSESIEMHVEFRRQTYSWSLAELALTIALVEVGGVWATVARPGRISVRDTVGLLTRSEP